MAKYLEHDGHGGSKEVQPVDISVGAADAGKMVQLDATGRVAESMMPAGIGADTASLEASESLSAGDLVNIWDDAGVSKVRKADATASGMECNGFVLSAVTAGSQAEVYFGGTNNQASGLTSAAFLYLDDVISGGLTETPPTASGNIVQVIGKAYSPTEYTFQAFLPVELV